MPGKRAAPQRQGAKRRKIMDSDEEGTPPSGTPSSRANHVEEVNAYAPAVGEERRREVLRVPVRDGGAAEVVGGPAVSQRGQKAMFLMNPIALGEHMLARPQQEYQPEIEPNMPPTQQLLRRIDDVLEDKTSPPASVAQATVGKMFLDNGKKTLQLTPLQRILLRQALFELCFSAKEATEPRSEDT